MLEEFARLISWLVPVFVLALIILPQAVRVLREYERGVIFRLGKLLGTKGPGLIFLIPIVDRMVKMDLRVVTIDVTRQEVMTRDNVPVTVDAVEKCAEQRGRRADAETHRKLHHHRQQAVARARIGLRQIL